MDDERLREMPLAADRIRRTQTATGWSGQHGTRKLAHSNGPKDGQPTSEMTALDQPGGSSASCDSRTGRGHSLKMQPVPLSEGAGRSSLAETRRKASKPKRLPTKERTRAAGRRRGVDPARGFSVAATSGCCPDRTGAVPQQCTEPRSTQRPTRRPKVNKISCFLSRERTIARTAALKTTSR
uniref:Uncharacterized protein n=1 Tax=Plectus sambesii TaxID=2011161 RepID=A0A914W2A1_9BILA